MSDEVDTSARPRASRFKEHTNTNGSIRPPPDELWKDLGIEQLIEQFNEENRAPPLSRKISADAATSKGQAASRGADEALNIRASSDGRTARGYEAQTSARAPGLFGAPSVITKGASTSAVPNTPAPAASEGTFGRFRNAFASVFGGVLGKRKTASVEVDKEKEKEKKVLDERKRAADAAYQEAKELGLLPTPKVFVRPNGVAKTTKSHKRVADTASPARGPRTPKLNRTPSKRDLQKQQRLSKRVSELELKLASAKKELQSVLRSDELPPIPPLPAVLPPTPNASQSENDADTPYRTLNPAAMATPVVTPIPLPKLAPKPAPAPTPIPVPVVAQVLAPAPTPVAAQTPEVPVKKVAKKRKATAAVEKDEAVAPAPAQTAEAPAKKVTKKRKATTAVEEDEDHVPPPPMTDGDGDISMDQVPSSPPVDSSSVPKRAIKRVKSSSSRKNLKKTQPPSSPRRSQPKKAKNTVQKAEEPVVVVPDGVSVPEVPKVPRGVKGKKVKVQITEVTRVGDDGYGGLEHEMF